MEDRGSRDEDRDESRDEETVTIGKETVTMDKQRAETTGLKREKGRGGETIFFYRLFSMLFDFSQFSNFLNTIF